MPVLACQKWNRWWLNFLCDSIPSDLLSLLEHVDVIFSDQFHAGCSESGLTMKAHSQEEGAAACPACIAWGRHSLMTRSLDMQACPTIHQPRKLTALLHLRRGWPTCAPIVIPRAEAPPICCKTLSASTITRISRELTLVAAIISVLGHARFFDTIVGRQKTANRQRNTE